MADAAALGGASTKAVARVLTSCGRCPRFTHPGRRCLNFEEMAVARPWVWTAEAIAKTSLARRQLGAGRQCPASRACHAPPRRFPMLRVWQPPCRTRAEGARPLLAAPRSRRAPTLPGTTPPYAWARPRGGGLPSPAVAAGTVLCAVPLGLRGGWDRSGWLLGPCCRRSHRCNSTIWGRRHCRPRWWWQRLGLQRRAPCARARSGRRVPQRPRAVATPRRLQWDTAPESFVAAVRPAVATPVAVAAPAPEPVEWCRPGQKTKEGQPRWSGLSTPRPRQTRTRLMFCKVQVSDSASVSTCKGVLVAVPVQQPRLLQSSRPLSSGPAAAARAWLWGLQRPRLMVSRVAPRPWARPSTLRSSFGRLAPSGSRARRSRAADRRSSRLRRRNTSRNSRRRSLSK
mmetsp:Transcript_73381/g.203736  ORF Transcript_73381/g.203736 Transcript_73381/m.203736 type:complete len:399 (+) Transcript_73381:1836-3032(+)